MDKQTLNNFAERLQSGDQQAGAELFDDLAPQTFRFFLMRTGHRETAQDLTQDVFVKVVAHIQKFDRATGDFAPWFWRIAHNVLIDHFRQKKPAMSLEDLAYDGEMIADPKDYTLSNARLREVLETVRTFTKEEQDLFNLYFMADISYTDLAKITGKTESNLRVMVHRLKQKISKHHNG